MNSGAFRKGLRVLGIKNREKLRHGLIKGAGYLQAVSQELVPIDTGRLHDSAHVVDETVEGGYPKVAVIYEAPYAVYVHENLDVYHPNGEAKFLEKPARTHRKKIVAQVRKGAREHKVGRGRKSS